MRQAQPLQHKLLRSAEPDYHSVWVKEQALLNNSTFNPLPSLPLPQHLPA